MREQIIKTVYEKKIIAIVRGVYGEDCEKLARALHAGGIDLIEVTFGQAHPEDYEKTCAAISRINEVFQGEVLAGAGTVTTPELVEMAHKAGAKYIISPDTNPAVIRRTRELEMVSMPGAMTPSEVMEAYRTGADFVKLFPMANLGVGYLKAVRAPLNQVPILVVGGVNEKNLGEFMAAGACGAGVGGNLVNKQWIKEGRFDDITALAREFIKAANA